MHVGMGTFFQNPQRARSDADVWRQGLELALTDVQRLVQRPEPGLQFGRGDHHRGQLVADGIEKTARISHAGPPTCRSVKSFS